MIKTIFFSFRIRKKWNVNTTVKLNVQFGYAFLISISRKANVAGAAAAVATDASATAPGGVIEISLQPIFALKHNEGSSQCGQQQHKSEKMGVKQYAEEGS